MCVSVCVMRRVPLCVSNVHLGLVFAFAGFALARRWCTPPPPPLPQNVTAPVCVCVCVVRRVTLCETHKVTLCLHATLTHNAQAKSCLLLRPPTPLSPKTRHQNQNRLSTLLSTLHRGPCTSCRRLPVFCSTSYSRVLQFAPAPVLDGVGVGGGIVKRSVNQRKRWKRC